MDRPQTQTILVVDDEPGIRLVLEKRLATWNFQVLTAENGRRAMALIQTEHPDVVITDLFMPEVDGFELLGHIRKTVPDLPVIVISGQGELGDVIQALRLGAWDYLYKPIEKASFLRLTLDRVLEKARLLKENRTYRHHLEELVAQKSSELAANERRYRIVADNAYNWEYWVAPDGNIVYISPSCERISGYSTDAFAANPSLLRGIIHPEDRKRVDRHYDDGHVDREIHQLEFRIVRRDGGQRWIGHTCLPVYDDQGSYLGRRGSNQDITYRKQIENDLNSRKQALIEKTISQQKANEALKSLLEQREIEKAAIEQTMVTNLKRFVFPYLDDLERLGCGQDAKAYVNLIRTNIEQLISPVSKKLSGAYLELTPMEIKVADLIRQGKSTKTIAAILKTSSSTVEKHRNKIRKKLHLLKSKVNLHTYLNSLA